MQRVTARPVRRVRPVPVPPVGRRRAEPTARGAAGTVRRLSSILTRELGRSARELTGRLGRRARAAGALAVLAAPAAGFTPGAAAQDGPPPAPAGVSSFDSGPVVAGPAVSGPAVSGPAVSGPAVSGPAVAGPNGALPPGYDPRGFAEPEQVFRGPEVRNPLFATDSPFQIRGRMEHNLGDGLGYEDGYTRASAFIPYLFADNSTLFFLDAGGFRSYTDGGGFNVGAGVRRYFGAYNRTVGGNVWFDYDSGFEDDVDFPRLGFGLESIGKYVSWRTNAYVPLDDREQVFSGITSDPFFSGRNIVLTQTDINRLAYSGLEGEVGGPLPVAGKYGTSGFVGLYGLAHDDDEDTLGLSGRVNVRVSNDLNVGGQLTTDDVFGTNVWATFTLSTPRGSWYDFGRTGFFREPTVFEQMDRAVVRHHRSFNLRQRRDRNEALTNRDGTDLLVCHVDPTVMGGGDGTVENPFGSFAPILGANNCLDGNCDIVRVIVGGAQATLTTNGPVNLSPNQLLLSTAETQTIDARFRGVATSVQLPGFTGGPRPILLNGQGTASYVVGLNDNNVVSGFVIDGTGPDGDPLHDGIISVGNKATLPADFNTLESHAPITSFEITRNTFLNVRDGIDIEHVGAGVGVIQSNVLTGVGFGDPTLGPLDPGFFRSGAGVDIQANGGSLTLLVADNTITNFLGEDINRNGILDANEDFRFNGTLTEGQGVLDEGIGLRVAALAGAAVDTAILRNAVVGNETGVTLEADGASALTASVGGFAGNGNTISDNTGRSTGLKMLVNNGSLMTVAALNNTIENNGLPPASGDVFVQPTIAVDPFLFPDNLFSNLAPLVPAPDLGSQVLAQVDGDLTGAGGSTLNLTLVENVISSTTNGGDMVRVESDGRVGPGGGSTVNFDARGNVLTGRPPQLGTVSLSFAAGPPIAPFPFHERLGGIILDVDNTALTARIGGLADGDGNTITQAAGAGIGVLIDGTAPGTSTASLAIEGNVITDTAFDEVNIPITNDETILAPIPLPDIPGQVGDSLLIAADSTPLFLAQNDQNQITPYQGDGIYVQTSGFAALGDFADGTNSRINRNTVVGAGGTTAVIGGGTVIGPADLPGDGIHVVARDSSTMTGLIIGDPGPPAGNGNVVTGNANGILVRRQGVADVDGTLIADNFASGNIIAGIAVQAAGDASDDFDVAVLNNNVTANNAAIPGVIAADGSGLRVESGGDSVIRLDVRNNDFVGNAGDGIRLTANGIDDAPLQATTSNGRVEGLIANNDVSANGADGLHVFPGVTTGTNVAGFSRAFTIAPDELFVQNNTFLNNSLSGVLLQGDGSATFADNLIAGNGRGLPDGAGAGILINGTYFGLNFNRDEVRGNDGDGVEILFDNFTTNFIRFTDLQVVDNVGRGYDVLNRGSVTSTLEIVGSVPANTQNPTVGSFISGNGGEATYIVNTASTTQGQGGPTPLPSGLQILAALQDGNQNHGLNRDGALIADPHLIFRYENNVVLANGSTQYPANGLVVRVGTSDGGTRGIGDDGGFASNVYAVAAGAPPGTSGDAYLDAITRLRGGVVAIVNANILQANVGEQFNFEGFTSTVDPPAGALNTTNGNITNYFSDPKARLDLVFNDNTFSNNGPFLDGAVTAGAWYDNAAPIKSRVDDNDPATPFPGAFPENTPETRRRNAQRLDPLGIPGVPVVDPATGIVFTVPAGSRPFPLVGIGESTFRVNRLGAVGSGVNFPNGVATSNDALFGGIVVPLAVDANPFQGESPFIWNLEP